MSQKSIPFFISVDDKIKKKLLLKLRIDNTKRIYLISLLGLFFFCLFMGLDYLRYTNGKILSGNLYFFLFLNHLSFLFFIFPVITIGTNRKIFAKRKFKPSAFFIYSWTIFLGMALITMAILSLIDRDSLTMYTIYIIIANFGLIMVHRDRILLNLISFLAISIACIFLFHHNMELLIINFMEIIGVTVVCLVVSTQMFNAYVNKLYSDYFLKEKNKEINKEKKRGDKLLHNILPKQIAKELMSKGSVTPRYYNSATIMLIDFKDFSTISKRLTPQELIKELDYCFKKFDHLTAKHNLEKIKTIGDAYLCVGGVPNNNITHAMNSIEAAHEILTFLNEWNTKRIANNEPPFESRIGIHTGSIIAGVVGDRKFVFDIWGDAVNTTARIESNGKAGQINISQTTYDLVKTEIECDHRGKIPIKNLDPIDMYFVKKN